MLIELHAVQNFPASNLNRDQNQVPKTVTFGGVTRLRVSSQSANRAQRVGLMAAGFGNSHRTKRVPDAVANRMVGNDLDAAAPKAERDAVAVAMFGAFGGADLFKDSSVIESLTTLFYLPDTALDQIAAAVKTAVSNGLPLTALTDIIDAKGKVDSKKKKALEDDATHGPIWKQLTADVVAGFEATLPDTAIDIALNGRFLASKSDLSQRVEGAADTAHWMSTHQAAPMDDFFAAVDDLQPNDETGAGHTGDRYFGAACFYRYASLDLDALRDNLDGDADIPGAVRAWVTTWANTVPSAMQRTMAAHCTPTLVAAVVRPDRQKLSAANAYAQPVPNTEGLVRDSCQRLLDWVDASVESGNLGDDSVVTVRIDRAGLLGSDPLTVPDTVNAHTANLDAWADAVLDAAGLSTATSDAS